MGLEILTHSYILEYNWLVVSTPLKNISQLGLLFPIYGKIKNVPNHQPDNDDQYDDGILRDNMFKQIYLGS